MIEIKLPDMFYIGDAINKAKEHAELNNDIVSFDFNGKLVIVRKNSDLKQTETNYGKSFIYNWDTVDDRKEFTEHEKAEMKILEELYDGRQRMISDIQAGAYGIADKWYKSELKKRLGK